MFYCCIPLCTSKAKEITMHRFPVDENLCPVWLQILGLEKQLIGKSMKNLRSSFRVCDHHFAEEARIINGKGRWGTTIKVNAVPSLLLPNQENKENQVRQNQGHRQGVFTTFMKSFQLTHYMVQKLIQKKKESQFIK